jgi:beta-N-acetylhexosaminidase
MFATKTEIRRAAGNLITCGFAGPSLSSELKELLREVNPVGLIVFARNITSVEALAELNRELKMWRKDNPLMLSVDQEGGRVARVQAPATVWPAMRALGHSQDPSLPFRVGQALAQELRSLHFDMDYAPVLDVDTNPQNPVIGDRSFSRNPQTVASVGKSFIEGMQSAGVAACGKHFPGHGDTDTDSHVALPYVEHDPHRLEHVEWVPFKAAVQAQVAAMMTAHVMVPCIDAQHPATLSKAALQPLRKNLGFQGVIISDDIEMKAVSERYTPEEMASLGLQAGVDMFLACNKPETTLALYRGIVQAVERGEVSHKTLLACEARVLNMRNKYYQPPSSEPLWKQVLGCAQHQELAELMHRCC